MEIPDTKQRVGAEAAGRGVTAADAVATHLQEDLEAMRVLSRSDTTLSSSWLVRVLARSGRGHSCGGCGGRMFVETGDGLCPVCRSRRLLGEHEISQIVDGQLGPSDWL